MMEKPLVAAAAIGAIPYAADVLPLFDAVRHKAEGNNSLALLSVGESAAGLVLGPTLDAAKYVAKVGGASAPAIMAIIGIVRKAEKAADAVPIGEGVIKAVFKKVDDGAITTIGHLPGKKLGQHIDISKIADLGFHDALKNARIPGKPALNGKKGKDFVKELLHKDPANARIDKTINMEVFDDPGKRVRPDRRPDLYDETTGRAIEVKNYAKGKPGLNKIIKEQLDRDVLLRNAGD
ncbi:MAG: hypothetical protein KDK39_14990 [Leptospiraceae bacterium]|nr:hypothetical protein [Leptospiraceae bacterium]